MEYYLEQHLGKTSRFIYEIVYKDIDLSEEDDYWTFRKWVQGYGGDDFATAYDHDSWYLDSVGTHESEWFWQRWRGNLIPIEDLSKYDFKEQKAVKWDEKLTTLENRENIGRDTRTFEAYTIYPENYTRDMVIGCVSILLVIYLVAKEI